MINNLVDYDLPNAMAFVIEGGVARDPAMLTSILEYKNKIDDIDMRTQQAYYDADKRAFPSTKIHDLHHDDPHRG